MILFAVMSEKVTGWRLVEANSLSAQAQGMLLGTTYEMLEVIEGMGMAETVRSRYSLLFDEASSKQAIASSYAGLISAISKSFFA